MQRLRIVQPNHPSATRKTYRPSGEQAARPDPTGVKAENHGPKRLQNPQAPEQLQIERELRGQKQNDEERAGLCGERGYLGEFGLARGSNRRIGIGLPKIAGEGIQRRSAKFPTQAREFLKAQQGIV